jgi:hypothetical protein
LAGSEIGGKRNLIVLDASDVLYDGFAVWSANDAQTACRALPANSLFFGASHGKMSSPSSKPSKPLATGPAKDIEGVPAQGIEKT